jgi:hypothetical protein
MGTDNPAPALGFMPRGDNYALTAALVCAVLVLTVGIANAATGGGVLRMLGVETQAAGDVCNGTLCISAITPDHGVTPGGTTVSIIGSGFPANSHTTDYYTGANNLVAHFDAINNTGAGDQLHSANTQTWKNLAGSDQLQLKNDANGSGWQSNGYKFANTAYFYNGTIPSTYPKENEDRTIEIIFTNPSSAISSSTSGTIFEYGNAKSGVTGKVFGMQFYTGLFYNIEGNNASYNMAIPLAKLPTQLKAANALNTATSVYTTTPANSSSFVNGVDVTSLTDKGSTALATDATGVISVGDRVIDWDSTTREPISVAPRRATNFKISSVRIYNKALNAAEIAQNAAVDKARFLSPPTVTVGGQNCTDLIVVSSTVIQCKTSTKTTGKYDVVLNYDGKSVTKPGAYQYIDPSLTSNTPSKGPQAGGTVLTINGTDFPYSPASDYAQNGLVGHFDGIDNLNMGDRNHVTTSQKWKNLKGDDNLILQGDAGATGWESNGYRVQSGKFWQLGYVPSTWPTGNTARTMEVAYVTPDTTVTDTNYKGIFSYGQQTNNCDSDKGKVFGIQDQRISSGAGQNYWSIEGCNEAYNLAGSSPNLPPELIANTKTNTITSLWPGNWSNVKAYVNGIDRTSSFTAKGTSNLNTASGTGGKVKVGRHENDRDAAGFKILSVRMYNRVLTDMEIYNNGLLDQQRFLSPPVVSVGGANCTDVVVLSKTQMTCKVPGSASLGKKDISVSFGSLTKTISQGFEYVSDTAFYITSVSPTIGPKFGGQTIALFGNQLNTVNSVTIGGQICAVTEKLATKLSCTTPAAANAGLQDIIVKYNNNAATETLGGIYEYLDVTDQPVDFRVARITGDNKYSYKLVDENCNSSDVSACAGPKVEANWNGITTITLKYPSTLTTPAEETAPTGFTKSLVNQNGIKTLTLNTADGIPQTAPDIAATLGSITFSTGSLSNTAGEVTVTLSNVLW